jgi:CheY-like chemotaxis protein
MASCLERLPRLDGVTVLVVDNESDARSLVPAVLENCGARVITTEATSEALAILDREVPDVLLSDIAMPIEDGYVLIRKVRSLPDSRRHIPVAALTAFANATDRARTLLAGYQPMCRSRSNRPSSQWSSPCWRDAPRVRASDDLAIS